MAFIEHTCAFRRPNTTQKIECENKSPQLVVVVHVVRVILLFRRSIFVHQGLYRLPVDLGLVSNSVISNEDCS